MIQSLILDGTITLVALSVLALEIAAIVVVARSRGRRPSASAIANALSGLFLILALRAALLDQGAGRVALWLGLALVAHAADLVSRYRRGG